MVKTIKYEIETGRDTLHNITDNINKTILDSKIVNGVVTVETTDAGAGILLVNCQSEMIKEDVINEMRKIVPARINYKYQESPEAAAGNIKSSLFSKSVNVIVEEGKLICEDKQEICLAEYDGPNRRTYTVCVIGE